MIQNLFEIPLWYDYIDPNTYNKTQLLTSIENNYKINPKRNNWKNNLCDMHHGHNDFDNPQYEKLNFNILKVVYQNKIKNFISEVLGDMGDCDCHLDIVNYTAMRSSGHMGRHDHFYHDTSFVGVHYLKFDPTQNSNIRFWNPHTTYPMLRKIHPELDNISVCQQVFVPEIREDMILIYPSFLEHDIPQQGETDSSRISIAFNFNFYKDESND